MEYFVSVILLFILVQLTKLSNTLASIDTYTKAIYHELDVKRIVSADQVNDILSGIEAVSISINDIGKKL